MDNAAAVRSPRRQMPCSRPAAALQPHTPHMPQVIAIVMAMPPLVLIDYTVCAACCPNPGARWFLLHALGNFVVAVLGLE